MCVCVVFLCVFAGIKDCKQKLNMMGDVGCIVVAPGFGHGRGPIWQMTKELTSVHPFQSVQLGATSKAPFTHTQVEQAQLVQIN